MKIDYVLMGIDEHGNTVLEHSMSPEDVIKVLAAALKADSPTEDESADDEPLDEAPVPSKRKCSVCGKTGHSKAKCSKVGAAPVKQSKSKVTDEIRQKIIELRNDGYSGLKIETELGLSKSTVYKVLNEEGISGKSKKSDDMRCAKCGEKGHAPSNCPTGDALDQLDKAEGWTESKPSKLNAIHFSRIKLSQSHDLPADVVARNMDLDVSTVERAFQVETYSEFLSAQTS